MMRGISPTDSEQALENTPMSQASDYKRFLDYIFFHASRDVNHEQAQALARIAISLVVVLIVGYLALSERIINPPQVHVIALSVAYLIFSVPYYSFVSRVKNRFLWRCYVVIITDLSMVSLATYAFGGEGFAFYPLFLWIVIGNGLRFGVHRLRAATVVGVVGFILATFFNNSWYEQPGVSFGLLAGLLILPKVFLVLIKRLAKANEAMRIEIAMRKQAEKQITASLKEKELLLSEIHHRVKNNLNVVSSLIGIQAIKIKDSVDPSILAPFLDTKTRIQSMALVHERLYRSEDFAHMDFASYTQQLAVELFSIYEISSSTVSFNTQIEDIQIDINQAVPCGMILSELLTNALKYAFQNGRNGKITVTLKHCQDGVLELSVSDDGIGFPEGLDVKSEQTVGLAIVNALVRQLNGEMVVDRNRGTRFQIRFKGS